MNLRNKLGRIFFTIIGAFVGNVIGALVGFGVGTIVDRLHREGLLLWDNSPTSEEVDPTDFILSALVLAAAVVKSDGEVEELELSYIRSFLADQFGEDGIQNYMDIMERSLVSEWDLRKVTHQIRQNTSYETRLQILYFLFGIANADYNIDDKEIATIKIISLHLGLSSDDHGSIKAMFYNEMDAHYKILEIAPSVSDYEVKAAYKKMAKKFHPDKIAHLGDAVEKTAESKFQKLQEAYEAIQEQRGFK